MLRTLALNRHRNQRHQRRLEKRPDPATAMLSRDETRGKRDNNRGGVMWQRSTKERRGNGSYLVLNGQCLGAAVYVVWRLLLCLVTGRGGVEVVSI